MLKGKVFIACTSVLLLLTACKKNNEPFETPGIKQADIPAIDTKTDAWLTKNNMPGLSLAVSKNGKLVYNKGYGVADKEANAPVTTDARFRVASVSKLITSVAVMKLLQDGKLTMESKVFGNSGILSVVYGTQPYKQYVTDITVSDLLHHTIGGWGQDNDPAFFDNNMNATAVINHTLDHLPLTKKPGTSFAYSNFGYMLLSAIIEKVSGKPYTQYVTEEIWNKVGAGSAAIAGMNLSDRQINEVKYYGQGSESQLAYNYTNFQRANGAMGWLVTASDLLRFATAVDSSSGRPDILSLQTIKTMVTPTANSIGFGWHFGCGWVVEQGEWFWWGSLPGTFSILYRNVNGICISATSNSRTPTPNNALVGFIDIVNFIASDNTIPWQDIDQF
ncbi:MAG: beta-lactamase family protein [Chitinophagaceae bacterium]|nr:beta-lactamase family protein [Chitinophagaceae bacterium]